MSQADRYTAWIKGLMAMVVIVGAASVWSAIREADLDRRQSLLNHAGQLTETINRSQVQSLAGSEADRDNPGYLRLKQQLTAARSTHADWRFVYVLSRDKHGAIIILVDSEPVDSTDYVPPGETFEEAPWALHHVVETGRPTTIGPVTDRWGTWISAYYPVFNPFTGDIPAIVGIDIDAGEWQRQIHRAGRVPALYTLLLLLTLLAGHRAVTRQVKHAESGTILIFGLILSTAFAQTTHKHETQHQHNTFTALAQARMGYVLEAFLNLRDLQLEGLARFFEGSEEVSPEEFEQYASHLSSVYAVRAWCWLPAVQQTARTAFEEEMRSSGLADYHLWEWDAERRRVPVKDRQTYFPVAMISPSDRTFTLGYDLYSEPTRADALDEARRTGFVTATDTIALVADGKPGALVLRPVYADHDPTRLRGFVMAVLDWERLLSAATQAYAGEISPLHIDLIEWRKDASIHHITSIASGKRPSSNAPSVTRQILAFGNTYTLEARPTDSSISSHLILDTWIALLAGLAVTGVTALAVGLFARRREELEWLVDERTTSLQKSKARYDELATQSRSVTWEMEPSGLYTYVSEMAEAVWGYKPEDLVGKKYFFDLHPAEGRDAFKETAFAIAETKAPFVELENPVQTPDGQIVWVSSNGIPILDENGTLLGYRGVDRDITQRKKAEAERELIFTAMEQASESIIITDAVGKIQYVNRYFEKVSGYTKEEVIGQNPRILKSGRQDHAFYQEMWRILSSGHVWEGTLINLRKDGSALYEEAVITPVKDAAGKITNYVAVKRDTTREQDLQRQLVHAQKMESVGLLAGGVAHDFNNILTVIMGNAELLQKALSEDSPHRHETREILQATERAANLTRQLLSFSRKETVTPLDIDLNEVIRGMQKMLDRLVPENMQLTFNLHATALPVHADPGQIEQILLNLVVNARDAIGEHGTIGIGSSIRRPHTDSDEIYFDAHCAIGEMAVVSVSDNGTGIAADHMDHIFDPFFTTKELGKGTGLGLSTVFGIVQQHNGTISVETSVDQGTVFRVYLPISGTDAIESVAKVDDVAARGTETILIVEDDPTVCKVTARMLEDQGYTVLKASNGEEALRMAHEHKGSIDLLFTDIIMPGMSGPDVAKQMNALYPDMPVLFASGYPADHLAKAGLSPDVVALIKKPFSTNELSQAIRSTLDAGTKPIR